MIIIMKRIRIIIKARRTTTTMKLIIFFIGFKINPRIELDE